MVKNVIYCKSNEYKYTDTIDGKGIVYKSKPNIITNIDILIY